eukprot:3285780-Rhodomonas_salina.2
MSSSPLSSPLLFPRLPLSSPRLTSRQTSAQAVPHATCHMLLHMLGALPSPCYSVKLDLRSPCCCVQPDDAGLSVQPRLTWGSAGARPQLWTSWRVAWGTETRSRALATATSVSGCANARCQEQEASTQRAKAGVSVEDARARALTREREGSRRTRSSCSSRAARTRPTRAGLAFSRARSECPGWVASGPRERAAGGQAGRQADPAGAVELALWVDRRSLQRWVER